MFKRKSVKIEGKENKERKLKTKVIITPRALKEEIADVYETDKEIWKDVWKKGKKIMMRIKGRNSWK